MSRFGYAMATYFAAMGVAIAAFLPLPLKLVWNASASVPIGLYAIDSDELPEVTDLVAVDAPEPLATFLAERGYLPHGVPLMKRIAGLPGHQVCRIGARVTVGHAVVLHACTVEDECLIGMGSIILDGAVVQQHVLLGAG